MTGNWQKRFDVMTPTQKHILSNMWDKIKSCEGVGMPKEYWCTSCTSLRLRLCELFIRFEVMNVEHRLPLPHQWSTFIAKHPGFSDPDSTNGRR